jgi:hypothetical protein
MASGLFPESNLGLKNTTATKVASKHLVTVADASKRSVCPLLLICLASYRLLQS